jgi:putative Mn2+ efflux pump MntP
MVTVFIGSIGGAYLSKYVSDNNRERIAGTIETIIGPWYLLRSFGLVP